MTTPRIFLSYSHDSPEHGARVKALADHLIEDGLNVLLDEYLPPGGPPEGWATWMENSLEAADKVLVACTETYLRRYQKKEASKKGKGVTWEGAILKQALYDAQDISDKFAAVIFAPEDEAFIPAVLRERTWFQPANEADYEQLYRFLTNQSATTKPKPGGLKKLPSEPAGPLQFEPTTKPYSLLRRLFRWWPDRKAERRYLRQLVQEHQYFTFLGRDTPLDLDRIYIALKVGNYVPPQEKPDDHSAGAGENSGAKCQDATLEVTEALLRNPPRLLVLGEPGSGKTTLLKYLALRIASRDPAFGEFARKSVRNTSAVLADTIERRLAAINLRCLGFPCYVMSLVTWLVALPSSPRQMHVLLAWFILYFTLYAINKRRAVAICSGLTVAVLTWFGWMKWIQPWAVGVVAATLLIMLYRYWIQPPVIVLRWLRQVWTRYPLPVYATLNDLAGSNRSVEDHLARCLEEVGLVDGWVLARRKLEAGECLLLLDALDEVVDEAARDQVAEGIVNARGASGNPVLVTCRIAAFADRSLEYRFPGFWRMEVQKFTEPQLKLFIQGWFADQSPSEQQEWVEGLLSALARSARMRSLATNPLLLSLLALVYERDLKLPERRVDLYRECANLLLAKWDRAKRVDTHMRFDPASKLAALQRLAVRFHQAGVHQFTRQDLDAGLKAALPRQSGARREEFLQELAERSGLIRRKSQTTYDFAHLTLQEYFAAIEFNERKDAAGLLAHLGEPWWQEVILLFVALQSDASGLLEQLRRHDVFIAAAALADVQPVAVGAVTCAARDIIAQLRRLVEANPSLRLQAAEALAVLWCPQARAYLVDRVRGPGPPEASLAAALALGCTAAHGTLHELWLEVGPILRLLHMGLGSTAGAWNEQILTVLERLRFQLVFVPAGKFVMGPAPRKRKKHTTYLPAFWIGKYPVTNAQFARFAEETGHTESTWSRAFTTGKECHPVVNVTWHEALAFCQWAGGTLPSEAEWEKSARGTDERTYPWGDRWDASRCNTSQRGTTPVDQYPNGVSPFGCYDMAGNAREWTRSRYEPYPYDPRDGRESLEILEGWEDEECHIPNDLRVMRGGSWYYGRDDVRCTNFATGAPFDRYLTMGFRIAVSPF